MSEVVSYKCPNCGGPVAFDIQKQTWDCKFCLSDFSLSDLEGQAQSTMENAASEQGAPASDTYESEATAYSCPSCGGHIVTDANTTATFCPYCHNPTVIAARLENEHRPASLIPFKLEKDEILPKLKQHLKKKPLLPRDFLDYVEKGEVTGLYVPFWLYDVQIDSSLEGRGNRVSTWRDSRYIYTKTDTYRISRAANIAFQNVPADGSKRMDDSLMQALEPFDYSSMQQFSMSWLSGHFAESYDVDAREAGAVSMGRIRQSVDSMMNNTVSGYVGYATTNRQNNVKSMKYLYAMLPVWLLTSRYREKIYTFAMNGQTGKMSGKLPISRKRLWTLFGILTAVFWALFFVGGMLI